MEKYSNQQASRCYTKYWSLKKLTWWEILLIIVDVMTLLGLCTYGFVWGGAKQDGISVSQRMKIEQFLNHHLGDIMIVGDYMFECMECI